MRVTVYSVASQKKALEALANLVEESTIDPLVRNAAIALTSDCDSRDDECEVNAIFNAVKHGDDRVKGLEKGLKYMSDPRWADFFSTPARTLRQLGAGYSAGDCLPADTLLLGAGYKPFPIGEAKVGDLVMGDGKWTRITAVMDKGIQELLEFKLNNGCVLRCTPEHKLFVVPKTYKQITDRSQAIEVRAGDVRPGDDLLTIDTIPEGNEAMQDDHAWLLGTYVADGWMEYSSGDGRPLRAFISGLDGWRKEGQKSRAEEICDRHGIHTRWHKKYLAINDDKMAAWMASCGQYAPQKHLPSMNWNKATVASLLSGLAADCEVRDGVFGTTSAKLALQYRVLLRMLGTSSHLTCVSNHGGFGKHPIYRVTPRKNHADGTVTRPFAKVKSISEGGSAPTFDIEVEGHRFYLPETDLIVHNCDDHAALICGLLGSLGFVTGLRAYGRTKGEFDHVYAVVGLPKIGWSELVGLDTTVEESEPGWEPPNGFYLTALMDGT